MDGLEFLRTPSYTEPVSEPVVEQTEQAPVEPVQESQPSEYSFGDDFKIPESFEKPEDELSWYKNNYQKIYGSITSQDFYNKVFEQYKDQILSQEEEAEQIRQTYLSLKNNPKDYIRQYFPETLAEIGVQPVMSDEEITSKVDEGLKEKFGENYRDLYSAEDLAPFKGRTLSRQIQEHGDLLHKQYNEQNERNRSLFEEYRSKLASPQSQQAPLTDEDAQKYIDEQYEHVKDFGITKEEYGEFVESLKSYQPTVKDFYRMKNFDNLLEQARKSGIEEGKKSVTANIGRAAHRATAEPKPVTPPASSSEMEDFFTKQLKKGNLIPF